VGVVRAMEGPGARGGLIGRCAGAVNRAGEPFAGAAPTV